MVPLIKSLVPAADSGAGCCLQERLSRKQQVAKWTRITLRFLLANWYKFVVLGVIITLIVLVAVKVRNSSCVVSPSGGYRLSLVIGRIMHYWGMRALMLQAAF